MALDLSDRDALKALIAQTRRDYAASNSVAVPRNFDQQATRRFRGLDAAGASIEEAELKSKVAEALEAGKKGAHFVDTRAAVKELDQWLAPMRPAPVVEGEEGEGDAE